LRLHHPTPREVAITFEKPWEGNASGYPADHPVSPEMLSATIFHTLGISPETRIHDAFGRPVPVMGGGEPILDLFG
jgi:hypothetical protein